MSFSKTYKVIGIMSGTSLDGIDLAYIEFEFQNKWKYELGVCETISYDEKWKNELEELHQKTKGHIKRIDYKYAKLLACIVNTFILENNLKVDVICSHGHTVLHQPEKGLTLQIGDGQELHRQLSIPVVFDFRSLDVALGGQGAPLVPIGDKLLFNNYDYCLNLGGFSNFSYSKNGERLAYDICPVNIALNHFAKHLGKEYDASGNIARQGIVNTEILNLINGLDFYSKAPPKSLGKEWFEKEFLPLLTSIQDSPENYLRTLCEHISHQIALAIPDKRCLVSGGGAFNTFLMNKLNEKSNCEFILGDKKLIEYKEALIFGLLGVLKIENQINCLASVTGAKRDSIVGKYFI